jgi:hypothetical protein
MNYEIINVGTLPNDGSGDPMRTAFIKINNNFAVATNYEPAGNTGGIQYKKVVGNVDSFASSANFVYDDAHSNLVLGANIIPLTDNQISIGTSDLTVGNLYLGQQALNIGNINVTESGNLLSFNVAVFPSQKADIQVSNITYGNTAFLSTLTVQTSTTNPVSVYEIPVGDFDNGKFEIVSRENSSNNSQSITIVASKTNDSTDISYTAFNTIFTGNVVTNYSVDVAFSNVRVIVVPYVSSLVTHKVTYQINT